MSAFLWGAAGLSLFTCGVHLFAGGPTAAKPLLEANDIEDGAKYTNYYCWHIVSIVLLSMALGFGLDAYRGGPGDLSWLMTAFAIAFMVWSVVLIVWKKQPWLRLPQWTLFVPIVICGAAGLR